MANPFRWATLILALVVVLLSEHRICLGQGNPGIEGDPGSADPDVAPLTRGISDLLQAAHSPQLFSGAMTWQIPIDVPIGRKGIQPHLQLLYRSSSQTGWMGVGWDVDLGVPSAIERSVRFGLDFGGDSYVIRMSGGAADLVSVGNGTYHQRIESSFWRIRQIPSKDGKNYWEATDKSGIRYLYGESTASRQDDPSDMNRIFKWSLDRIQDPDGNYLTVAYSKPANSGELYIDHIDYAGNGSVLPTTSVRFSLESRDDAYPGYSTGFRVVTGSRLETIDVSANGQRVRAYKLAYANDPSGDRSLLTSVQEFGSDATIDKAGVIQAGSSMPIQQFGWRTAPGAFGSELLSAGMDPGYAGGRAWVDVNGDGKVDYCRLVGIKNNESSFVQCTLSTGTGFGQTFKSALVDWGYSEGRAWVDVNGDGKADFCRLVGDENHKSSYATCTLSTGIGFGQTLTSDVLDWGYEPGRAWVDFNGDGKVDYCRAVGNTNHVDSFVQCTVSTGSGFGQTFTSGVLDWGRDDGRAWVDVNGDGKADYCRLVGIKNNESSFVQCTLSTGTGFGQTFTSALVDWGYVDGRAWVDFNGDGNADFCRVIGISGDYHVQCTLSTGAGFGDTYTSQAIDPGDPATRRWSDINGDGKADFCRIVPGNILKCLLSTGDGFAQDISSTPINPGVPEGRYWSDIQGVGVPSFCSLTSEAIGAQIQCLPMASAVGDLLTSISNGFSGIAHIEYSSSTQYANIKLPFTIPAVAVISIDDGRGSDSETAFTYGGGFYSVADREFRGYNYVKVQNPAATNGAQAIEERWFHQGNDTAVDANNPDVPVGYTSGKLYRLRVSDPAGNRFSETTTTYQTPTTASYYFTPPEQIDHFTCDGTLCEKQTRIQYAYDTYGNPIRETHNGDVDDESDDFTVIRSFLPNVQQWIVGLASDETDHEGTESGPVVAKTHFYYDGSPDCETSSAEQSPTRGNLTQVTRWLGNSPSPSYNFGYDSFGNTVCERDPNGNLTSLAYDSSHTLPTKQTDAKGFTTTKEYYGLDGTSVIGGTFGQLRSATDANNAITTISYDPLSRPSSAILADGSTVAWTYTAIGEAGVQNIRIDLPEGISEWSYFDGLGRLWLRKHTGPDKTIVSEQLSYDARGLIAGISLPYIEATPTPPAQWQQFDYDPIGRLTLTVNPDGSQVRSCYKQWTASYVDPNGHLRRFSHDAFDRLVKVEEFRDTFASCVAPSQAAYSTAVYHYDVLGDLNSITDAKNSKTELSYDSLGRNTELHDPDAGIWRYGYDANGNVISQTDAIGDVTRWKYDELNRLAQESAADQHGRHALITTYHYDGQTSNAKGRLSGITEPSGASTFAYDPLGRVISSIKVLDKKTYSTKFQYDAVGRLTHQIYPDGHETSYSYDGPVVVSIAQGNQVYSKYTDYNVIGVPEKVVYGNGVVSTRSYSGVGKSACVQPNFRLCSIKTADSDGRLFQDIAMDYDLAGNVVAVSDASVASQKFSYDHLNRVTSASGPFGVLSYNYDEAGNIVEASNLGAYSYTNASSPHQVTSVGKVSYVYDANGNLVKDGLNRLTYDSRGRLKSVRRRLKQTVFTYNEDGSRASRTTKLLFVGLERIRYISNSFECSKKWAFVREKCEDVVAGPAGIVAFRDARGDGVLFYHDDQLRSTVAVTDSKSHVAEKLAYSPFGSTSVNTRRKAVASRQFTGQIYDNSTGYYYYRARYYDPTIGRFITPDNVVPNLYLTQAANPYTYAYNNPVNLVDPTGNAPDDEGEGEGAEKGDDDKTGSGVSGGCDPGCGPVNVPGPGPSTPAPHQSGDVSNPQGDPRVSNNTEKPDESSVDEPKASTSSRSPDWEGRGGLGSTGHSSGPFQPGHLPSPQQEAITPTISPMDLLAGVGAFTLSRVTLSALLGGGGSAAFTRSPDFIVSPGGTAIPVPEGATRMPTVSGKGFRFGGGSGGFGLDTRTSGVRVMDPTLPRGPSPGYPGGYATYENAAGQTVNPLTGRTIPTSDAWWHIPLQ